jgi:hypothetical protein
MTRAMELKFKGKIHMGRPRTTHFSQVVEDCNKRDKSWYKTEKERMGEGKWGKELFVHQHL